MEIIDKLKGARYFTKLDVRWGYNNIRIKKGDEWKAAFKTNRGLFEPTVMFFGMCNSPATFQVMMDSIFNDLIGGLIIIVYMDDMFIFESELPPLIENTIFFRFLGFGNFYRRFIRGFSDLAQPDYYRRTGNSNQLTNVRSPSKH